MSILAMPSPPYHHGFSRDYRWQDAHSGTSPRLRERVALPSIRQAFPELQLQVQDVLIRSPSSATTPTTTPTRGPFGGLITPPEYVHSPIRQKRRRSSLEGEKGLEKTNRTPRLYASPHGIVTREQSPTDPRNAPEPWGNSNRASSHGGNGGLPLIPSPTRLEHRERVEPRPTLPSLVLLNFERDTNEVARMPNSQKDCYSQETIGRPSLSSNHSHTAETRSPVYRPSNYSYAFHHSNRVQSLSVGSVHPLDRAQFSPGPYGHQYHDTYVQVNEFGMGLHGDSKQRKRRGNLPKETTDKLRAWFMAHLHHPYPTEDEKQELMRQTGLQMNQISNWFINARRRQLPNMINNARAESDAMAVRGGEGNLIPSTERIDYEPDAKPLSDGEGSTFGDVELEAIKRRRVGNVNRGSI